MITENEIEAQLEFERLFSTIGDRAVSVAKKIYHSYPEILSSRFVFNIFSLESIDSKTFIVQCESIFRGEIDDSRYLVFPNQFLYDDSYVDIYIDYLLEDAKLFEEKNRLTLEEEKKEELRKQYELSKKFIQEYEKQLT